MRDIVSIYLATTKGGNKYLIVGVRSKYNIFHARLDDFYDWTLLIDEYTGSVDGETIRQITGVSDNYVTIEYFI